MNGMLSQLWDKGRNRMGSQNQQIAAKEQGWVLISCFNFGSNFKLVKYPDLLS